MFAAIAMACVSISLILIVWGGFSYILSQGEPKKMERAKLQIIIAGVVIFVALIFFTFGMKIETDNSPVETTQITVKETMVERYVNRGADSYYCNVTDSTSGEEFSINFESEIDAREACSAYKEGTTHTIPYKDIFGQKRVWFE